MTPAAAPEPTHPDAPRPRALLVIDVQDGFDDTAYWGPTSNPAAEQNIAALLRIWREQGRGPVVVVRHDSTSPQSPLHPRARGNRVQGLVGADDADLLVTKQVNSAFLGDPDLRAWLDAAGIRDLVLCGIQTNMCVETTARMGGNLGFAVTVVLDATRTFDLAATVPGAGVVTLSADELMRATAVNLAGGGFAAIATTAEVVAG